MAKTKVRYSCTNCGVNSAKWVGRCPTCNEWNTYEEEIVLPKKETNKVVVNTLNNLPTLVQEITIHQHQRLMTNDAEFNRVMGNGICMGSITLLSGEPGIGKSTLLLQISLQLKNTKVLYISGEESLEQIKLRANRIQYQNEQCYILASTDLSAIVKEIRQIEPQIIILDSVQTITSPYIDSIAGSMSQIKHCASELQQLAKSTGIPIFMVGHITKDGNIAGPKMLEHLVDTVLYFEGDNRYHMRLLRTTKNRFGPTSELGIYEMDSKGLKIVDEPSAYLISDRIENCSGIAIANIIEGARPLLVEVQALVSSSAFGTPQRSTTGYPIRRLNMMLAVLEKKVACQFGNKDVFVNITGGLNVQDPGVDVAIVAALLSSYYDIEISQEVCFAGEVGLSGEIRKIQRLELRLTEANKLRFKQIITPIQKVDQKGTEIVHKRVQNLERLQIELF